MPKSRWTEELAKILQQIVTQVSDESNYTTETISKMVSYFWIIIPDVPDPTPLKRITTESAIMGSNDWSVESVGIQSHRCSPSISRIAQQVSDIFDLGAKISSVEATSDIENTEIFKDIEFFKK